MPTGTPATSSSFTGCREIGAAPTPASVLGAGGRRRPPQTHGAKPWKQLLAELAARFLGPPCSRCHYRQPSRYPPIRDPRRVFASRTDRSTRRRQEARRARRTGEAVRNELVAGCRSPSCCSRARCGAARALSARRRRRARAQFGRRHRPRHHPTIHPTNSRRLPGLDGQEQTARRTKACSADTAALNRRLSRLS
jgi:hypothetical protein